MNTVAQDPEPLKMHWDEVRSQRRNHSQGI